MTDTPALSTTGYVLLELMKVIVPAVVAIGGGLWVAFTYLDGQREAGRREERQNKSDLIARRLEVQKPFSSIQLALFMEAGKIVGELAAFDKSPDMWQDSAEWKQYYTRFYQLFWTELSIVEDEDIKVAMQDFSRQLNMVLGDPKNQPLQKELNQVAYRLARAIRGSIEKTWDVDLGTLKNPSDK